MTNCDKAHIFLIAALLIAGFRFEIPLFYSLAIGICLGSATFYLFRIGK